MSQQFYDVLDAVWALDTDPTAKLVALRLARHWPRIWPGIQDIAHWTGLDERTVRRALKRLRDDGVIVVHQRPNTSSVYEFPGVCIPALGNKPPLPDVPGTAPPPPGTAPPPPGQSARSGPGTAPDKQPREQPNKPPSEREPASSRFGAEPRKRPEGKFEFDPAWKPKPHHRELGHSLGLTDDEMLQRAFDCKNKLYDHPFSDEDKQFNRELGWLRTDKETKAFKQKEKDDRAKRIESPGRHRTPDDPAPTPIFGRVRSAG